MGEIVEGVIVEKHGPSYMTARLNPWKWATGLVVLMALFPFLIMMWLIAFALKLALSMIGLYSGGGVLELFLFAGFLAFLFKRAPDVPVYHYAVATNNAVEILRQEGELSNGILLVGRPYKFNGGRHGGSLVIGKATDLETGQEFSKGLNCWPYLFAVSLGVLGCLLASMSSWSH